METLTLQVSEALLEEVAPYRDDLETVLRLGLHQIKGVSLVQTRRDLPLARGAPGWRFAARNDTICRCPGFARHS